MDMVTPVVHAIMQDNPELFWPNYYEYFAGKVTYGFSSTYHVEFQYFFDTRQKESIARSLEQQTNHVVSSLRRDLPQTTRIWQIYDYLARRVTYKEIGNEYSHTLVGCTQDGGYVAVCEGIAKMFKFLCQRSGIPCIIATGELSDCQGTELHAWNIVYTGDKLQHVDVTAALLFAKRFGKANSLNFLHADDWLERNGYAWDRSILPDCD